jgi:hypothetical protein
MTATDILDVVRRQAGAGQPWVFFSAAPELVLSWVAAECV